MTDASNMYMPVAPAYNGGYGNDGFLGGNSAWFLLVLLAMFGWGGNGFGFGGNGANTGADIQRGFDQSAVTTGIGNIQTGMCNGFAGVNQNMATGFAGVQQAIGNGFAQAEIANNGRQMADMNQMFGLQTALNTQLNSMAMTQQNCCCENRAAVADVKYAVANEAANTRANCDANNQKILDKLCQLELDGVKQNYEGQLRTMQTQLSNAQAEIAALRGDINRNALGSRILADNAAQTTALEQYLAPTARPAYIVQNPNCCGYGYGGCGGYNAA